MPMRLANESGRFALWASLRPSAERLRALRAASGTKPEGLAWLEAVRAFARISHLGRFAAKMARDQFDVEAAPGLQGECPYLGIGSGEFLFRRV